MIEISDGVVVAGAYHFRETFGLPLDVMAEALLASGLKICWDVYAREAVAAHMRPSKVRTEIATVAMDVYACPQWLADEAAARVVAAAEEVARDSKSE